MFGAFRVFNRYSGDGGNRTRVRRTVTKNLYMLSLSIETLVAAGSTNKACIDQPEKIRRRSSGETGDIATRSTFSSKCVAHPE